MTPFPGHYHVSFLLAEPGSAPSCRSLRSRSRSRPWSNGDRKPESNEHITGIFTQASFSSLSFWHPSPPLRSAARLPERLLGGGSGRPTADRNLPHVHWASSAFGQTHTHTHTKYLRAKLIDTLQLTQSQTSNGVLLLHRMDARQRAHGSSLHPWGSREPPICGQAAGEGHFPAGLIPSTSTLMPGDTGLAKPQKTDGRTATSPVEAGLCESGEIPLFLPKVLLLKGCNGPRDPRTARVWQTERTAFHGPRVARGASRHRPAAPAGML